LPSGHKEKKKERKKNDPFQEKNFTYETCTIFFKFLTQKLVFGKRLKKKKMPILEYPEQSFQNPKLYNIQHFPNILRKSLYPKA
jgi:hypothetical protein